MDVNVGALNFTFFLLIVIRTAVFFFFTNCDFIPNLFLISLKKWILQIREILVLHCVYVFLKKCRNVWNMRNKLLKCENVKRKKEKKGVGWTDK